MSNKSDSYSGFNDFNPLLDTDALKYDTGLQQAVLKTSHGRRAPKASRTGTTGEPTGGLFSKMKNIFNRPKNAEVPVLQETATNRVPTASRAAQQQKNPPVAARGTTAQRPITAQKRPATSIRGAGFMAGGGALGSYVTPATGPTLYEKKEESNEEKARKMEKKIHDLIEESCFAFESRDVKLALEKAEEAVANEKNLSRFREEKNINETDPHLYGCFRKKIADVTELRNNYQ